MKLSAEGRNFTPSGGEVDQTEVGAAPLIDPVLKVRSVANLAVVET